MVFGVGLGFRETGKKVEVEEVAAAAVLIAMLVEASMSMV